MNRIEFRLVINSIIDELKSRGIDLPPMLKRRDRREPGRLAKESIEDKLTIAIRRKFKEQYQRIIEYLTMRYPERKDIIKPPDPLDDIFEDDDKFIADIIKLLYVAGRGGVELFRNSVSIGLDYSLINDRALDWAGRYAGELIKGINETSRKLVGNAIQRFVDTPGFTLGDISSQLSDIFGVERARTIAVTETTRSYAEGERLAGLAMKEEFPDVKVIKTWFTNRDDIVCDICAAMDGEEVEIDKPFSGGIDAPPAHVNCILPGNIVDPLGKILAMTKSFYNGRCIEITLANGRRIAITQNHPILTDRGWVFAKCINKSDNIISALGIDNSIINPNDNQRPAEIEKIFTSLEKSVFMSSSAMPISAKDFYGDGKFIDGDIQIININSLLSCDTNAAFFQPVSQLNFIPGSSSAVFFTGSGAQNLFSVRNNPTSGGYMSVGKHRGSLSFGGIAPADEHRIGNISRADVGLYNSLSKCPTIDARLARKFLLRFSSSITSEKVSKIRYFNFCGHVYNLQSEPYNLYSVNGIITHNCRCWIQTGTKI